MIDNAGRRPYLSVHSCENQQAIIGRPNIHTYSSTDDEECSRPGDLSRANLGS